MHTRTLALFGLLILQASVGWAQVDALIDPTRGFQPSHSYSISDIESIDNASGSLSLHIPLAQMPAGPAGFTAGVTFMYSSKYWETQPSIIPNTGTNYYLVDSQKSTKLAMAPQLEIHFLDDPDEWCSAPHSGFELRMIETDGSSHQLFSNNFSWPTLPRPGRYCWGTSLMEGTSAWYSLDGSFLQLTIDGSDCPGSTQGWPNDCSWILRRNDGSSVENGENFGASFLHDRNGNTITITREIDSEDPLHSYQTMSDPWGREIRVDHYTYTQGTATHISEDVITQVGHNGNSSDPLVWTITYQQFPTFSSPTNVYAHFQNVSFQWIGTWAFGAGPDLASSIQLPNGLRYEFEYGARYGELSSVTSPSGSVTEYEYTFDQDTSPLHYYNILANAVKTKTLNHDGVSNPETWAFTSNLNDGKVSTSTVTSPDGGGVEFDFAQIDYHPLSDAGGLPGGIVTETTQPDGSIITKTWERNDPYIMTGYTPESYLFPVYSNPWVRLECLARPATSTNSAQVFKVDKNGNIVEKQEHDWDTTCEDSAEGTLLRKTALTFHNPSGLYSSVAQDSNAYTHTSSPIARNLVISKEVQDASDVVSRSTFSYQESSPSRLVGNLVLKYDWDSTQDSEIESGTSLNSANAVSNAYTYTTHGNVLTQVDANGKTTTYTYASVSGCPDSQANSTDLYATKMERGGNPSVEQESNFTYNCYSGRQTTATNPNGLVTTVTYDKYSRPTSVADGSLRKTSYFYYEPDSAEDGQADTLATVVTTDSVTAEDQKNVLVYRYDQLGRVRLSQQLETAASAATAASASYDTVGILTQTAYQNSSGVKAILTSNPYRQSESSAPTRGWSIQRRDTMGRPCATEVVSGSSVPTVPSGCTSATSNSTGITKFSYSYATDHNTKTVEDPAGVKRHLHTDVLGRLTTVIEDTTGTDYTTTYTYDSLDNLTGVAQGSTSRTFIYSSLGRLQSANNPESGEITYTYDDHGNLLTRSMGAGGDSITITNTYDDLSRITFKNYSGTTPDVTYTYDTAQTSYRPSDCSDDGPIGQIASVATSVSANYYFYNKLGHTVCSRQKTGTSPSTTFDFKYTNTPQGEWKEITYPSGRTVASTIDDAARVTEIEGILGGNTTTYASGALYASHGSISQLALGNGAVETNAYNSNLQSADLKLGTTAGGSDLWRLQNGYLATQNNGSIVSQTLSIQGGGFSFNTYYEYDGVNRLLLTSENPPNPANLDCQNASDHWCQEFEYDARGNRKIVDGEFSLPTVTTFSSSNRISNAGFSYDSRGNLTAIPLVTSSDRYAYDGENRLIGHCTQDASSCPVSAGAGRTQYSYDGEGRRTTKRDQTGTVFYAYDAHGRLAAEYGGTVAGFGTRYLTQDHLGSTRVVTDAEQNIVMCRDYMPFGEEILGTATNGRNGISCYGPDLVRQKFTGYVRDAESRLDFAQARYYMSAVGRFNSSDEPFLDQSADEPQSWNQYSFVRNNPLSFIDPSGGCSQRPDGKLEDDPDEPCVKPEDRTVTVTPPEEEVLDPLTALYLAGMRSSPVIDAIYQVSKFAGTMINAPATIAITCAAGDPNCKSDIAFAIIIPGGIGKLAASAKPLGLVPQYEKAVRGVLKQIANGTTKGKTFANTTGALPSNAGGYYTEYTVSIAGHSGRGLARLVTGAGGEVYFTVNHYARGSFVRLQ
jgi:RHS repeat-associated protein